MAVTILSSAKIKLEEDHSVTGCLSKLSTEKRILMLSRISDGQSFLVKKVEKLPLNKWKVFLTDSKGRKLTPIVGERENPLYTTFWR